MYISAFTHYHPSLCQKKKCPPLFEFFLQTWEEKVLEQKQKQFWNQWANGNNLAACQIWNFKLFWIRITLSWQPQPSSPFFQAILKKNKHSHSQMGQVQFGVVQLGLVFVYLCLFICICLFVFVYLCHHWSEVREGLWNSLSNGEWGFSVIRIVCYRKRGAERGGWVLCVFIASPLCVHTHAILAVCIIWSSCTFKVWR